MGLQRCAGADRREDQPILGIQSPFFRLIGLGSRWKKLVEGDAVSLFKFNKVTWRAPGNPFHYNHIRALVK